MAFANVIFYQPSCLYRQVCFFLSVCFFPWSTILGTQNSFIFIYLFFLIIFLFIILGIPVLQNSQSFYFLKLLFSILSLCSYQKFCYRSLLKFLSTYSLLFKMISCFVLCDVFYLISFLSNATPAHQYHPPPFIWMKSLLHSSSVMSLGYLDIK